MMKNYLKRTIKVALVLLMGIFGTAKAQTWVAQIGSAGAVTHLGSFYGKHIAVSGSNAVYTAASYQKDAAAYSAGNPDSKIELSAPGGTNKFYLTKQDINGTFLWSREVTTSGSNSYATSVALDANENVYVTGAYGGTLIFRKDGNGGTANLPTPSGSTNDYAIFLMKYDKNGTLQWSKTLNPSTSTAIKDEALGLDIDADGNVLLAGNFSGTNVGFDWGTGKLQLSSNGTEAADGFVMKMNSAGNVLWAKRLGGAGADLIYALKTDANKNVYVTGAFNGTADFVDSKHQLTAIGTGTDAFVLKLDANGNFVWVKQFKSGWNCIAYDIAVDNNATTGGIVVVGEAAKATDFGGGEKDAASPTSPSPDLFVAKLKPNGDHAWSLYKGAPGWNERATHVAVDGASGNIFVTGLIGGAVSFAKGYNVNTAAGSTGGNADVFVLRLAANGMVTGAKTWGNTGTERGTGIALDANANVYVTGIFGSQPVTFGNAGTLTFKGASWDTFIFKMSPNEVMPAKN